MSGIWVRAGGQLSPRQNRKQRPQSRQAGDIAETPSTWLRLFGLPWRSPETPSHPTYRLTQAVNRDFSIQMAGPGSCFITSSVLSNKQQQLASVSPRPCTSSGQLDSQLGFNWKSPSPAQVATISDCFIAHAGWPQAKHGWWLTLASTTRVIPEPAHPVDNYGPCQSTTTLPLHS